MKPAAFELDNPATLAEALDLLAQHGDSAKVLAGGQSLVPMLNFRLVRPDRVINIGQLRELSYIRRRDDSIRIGALTRHADAEDSETIGADVPLLATAIKHIAHRQIRNRGTLGGSLMHNDPAAELPLVLLCLGADVSLASAGGERTVPVAEFLLPWLSTTAAP